MSINSYPLVIGLLNSLLLFGNLRHLRQEQFRDRKPPLRQLICLLQQSLPHFHQTSDGENEKGKEKKSRNTEIVVNNAVLLKPTSRPTCFHLFQSQAHLLSLEALSCQQTVLPGDVNSAQSNHHMKNFKFLVCMFMSLICYISREY